MSLQQSLAEAFSLHRSGRLAEAKTAYRAVLVVDPHDTGALMMLGIIVADEGDAAEAGHLFRRVLAVDPDHSMALHNLGRLAQGRGEDRAAADLFERAATGKPDLAPIFNDWAVSLNRMGERERALELLDHALSLDPNYATAHDNRGLVLYELRRFDQAAQAHFTALAKIPVENAAERSAILLHLSLAAYEIGELSAAERACRAILAADPNDINALDQLAKVLDRQLRDDEATALRNQLARSQGLVAGGAAADPKATVLIVGGVGAGHVPTRYLFDPQCFATLSLSMVSPDQPDAPLGGVEFDRLSEADVIFNSLGEVEKDGGQIQALRSLCANLGKPVLNPWDGVARTSRDNVQALFGAIDGLVVPGTRWADRDEVAALNGQPPMLVRPGGAHGGKDLALIDTPDAARDYLAKVPYDRFLLTEFFDFKGERDSYRKYRFIFIDRVPYAYHLAVGDHWLVHYWRAEMGRSDWKKLEEQRFLTDWKAVFGPTGAAAVEAAAASLDLDYGGMDCSLLPDGRVLLFEANACMLLHLDDSPTEFPYKHIAVPKIRDAVTRMILERLRA